MRKLRYLAIAYAVLSLLEINSSYAFLPEYKIAREQDIATHILVVDEHGKAIQGAEVWRVANPAPKIAIWTDTPSISLDYLNRVAARYKNVAEFAHQVRPGFFRAVEDRTLNPGFGCLDPTNAQGQTAEIIKFDKDRAYDVTVRYVAMNYGYIPAIVQVETQNGVSIPQIKIILQRDESIVLPSASYWQDYIDIRTRFSSGEWPEAGTEAARIKLIKAGQAAKKAGDVKSAARIYSWVPYVPTTFNFDQAKGDLRITGYTREDETSDRNIALLQLAAKLDPENRYIRMKLLLLRPPVDRNEHIKELEALVNSGRDGLWPDVFARLKTAYYANGEKEKAAEEFHWYKEYEPDDYGNRDGGIFKTELARYITLEEFKRDFLIGGDPNKADQHRNVPIQYAVRSGRVDFFDWLLKNGVAMPLPGYIGIQAVYSRSPAMLRRAMEETATDNNDIKSWLVAINGLIKARSGDLEELEEMKSMLEKYRSDSESNE